MSCNLVKIYQSFGGGKVLPPSSRQKRQYSPLKHTKFLQHYTASDPRGSDLINFPVGYFTSNNIPTNISVHYESPK
jgi:hypothetical protein